MTAVMVNESLSAAVPGDDFVELTVKQVVRETAEATSFVLAVPEHLTDAFRYESGQFVTVRPVIDGEPITRCYSMSSAPGYDDELRITVKRVAGGPVSNWLADHISAGDSLPVSRPGGRFVLGSDAETGTAPVVLFAGGSGITPVLSIVKSVLSRTDRAVSLFYANRNAGSVIFTGELAQLERDFAPRLRVVHHLDDERGVASPAAIDDFCAATSGGEFYVCGPGPFMATVQSTLVSRGIDRQRIHVEKFEIDTPAAPPSGSPAQVELTAELDGRSCTGPVRPGQTLLTAARSAGLSAPSSCEIGTCGTCIARLVDGEVRLNNNDVLTDDEIAEGLILMCQAMPTTATVRVVYE